MRNLALLVCGIVFAIIALLHLVRLFYPFPVVIGTYSIPEWVSLVAFLALGLLSAWAFRARQD